MTAIIPKEEIKSMINEYGMSPTSFPYGSDYSLTIKGNSLYLRTANRLEVFPLSDEKIVDGRLIYGIPTSREESGPRFYGWIANANNNPPNYNNYIPRISDITDGKIDGLSYIVSVTPLRMWLPHENDTKVELYSTHRILEAVDGNHIGKKESELENFRQKNRNNVMFNEANQLHYDISKWAEFLDEEGVEIIENPIFGFGIERGDFIAAFYPNKRYLVAEVNFHERAKKLASRYGLTDIESVEAVERSVLLHEVSHAYGIRGDRKGERLQGILQAKFYSKLAKEFQGTRWERIYNALAEEAKDYARSYSLLSHIWDEITNQSSTREPENIGILIKKFEIEAKMQGKEGRELVRYVEDRIENVYGELRGTEPSYNSQKSQSETEAKSKSQKSAPLEQIVKSPDIKIKNNVYRVKGNVIYLSEGNNKNQRAENEESTRTEETYNRRQKSGKADEKQEDNLSEEASEGEDAPAPESEAMAEAA